MIVPRLRSPIVLVHGLFGYDHLRLCGWKVASNFPQIPEFLQSAGNRVLVASLSPTNGVVHRAGQLKAFLDREAPGESVHLISHSMGGLDSRFMISRLDMAARVLSLTTVATPHRGTAFADWGVQRLGRLLKPVFEGFAIPYQAFIDLTTDACRRFNEEVPDAVGVRYFSVAGRFEGGWLNPEWQFSHRIVADVEGPNDGIVSLTSAAHGESCEVWEGDHLSLVNWPHPAAWIHGMRYDRSRDFTRLVQRLADEGF